MCITSCSNPDCLSCQVVGVTEECYACKANVTNKYLQNLTCVHECSSNEYVDADNKC